MSFSSNFSTGHANAPGPGAPSSWGQPVYLSGHGEVIGLSGGVSNSSQPVSSQPVSSQPVSSQPTTEAKPNTSRLLSFFKFFKP